MTGGFKKFIGVFLCAALALGLALGAYYGGGIRRAITQLDELRLVDTGGGTDGVYIFADAIMREQRNLYITCGETLSAPDPDKFTVNFAVRAVPFEIASWGHAAAFVRGHRIPLSLRDGVLTGSARLSLADLTWDGGPLEYRILMDDGNTLRNQVVTPEFYWDSPFVGETGAQWEEPYDGKLNLTFHYELDGAYVPFGEAAEKANVYALTFTYGGKGERAQDLMFNADFKDGVLDHEETFEVGENNLLRFYAEVVGESGMVYRYWLEDFISPAYEDRFDFPWWEEDLESHEYIYIAGTDDQVEFWF